VAYDLRILKEVLRGALAEAEVFLLPFGEAWAWRICRSRLHIRNSFHGTVAPPETLSCIMDMLFVLSDCDTCRCWALFHGVL
jgi:hypothetical protein